MEPRAKVELGSGKHSVYTHFPKDPNCDICLKTKITRASCRRRAGTVVPRAERFGGLITAEHRVLSEESESRNNHRYPVVVQDLATQWTQSYPCKTKSSQDTQKNQMKYWSRRGNQKSFTLTIPWNLASLARNYPGIIERQHHTDQKHMWRFGMPFDGPVTPFGAVVEYHPVSAKDQSIVHQFGVKVLAKYISRLCIVRGWNLERRHCGRRHWRIGGDGRYLTSTPEGSTQRSGNFIFLEADGTVKIFGENSVWQHPP